MKRIILITGGQRSGKSKYAEELALSLSPTPVYMATSRIWDEEFRQRVLLHQQRRGPQWTNIEEEKYLSRHDVTGRVVLIDCCTLWATNFFFDAQPTNADNELQNANVQPKNADNKLLNANVQPTNADALPDVGVVLRQLKDEFAKFTAQEATFIFVTNEIGLGGISDNALQRRFTDLQGWMNQHIASHADEVTLMVSGIPVKVK